MAIYHLSHGNIGKNTQKQAHTAAAHAAYITGPERATAILGARMPTYWREAMAWLDGQEAADRKNARIIDKLNIALPKELSHAQNAALVEAFCERLTEGRASWLAAIHDGPRDTDNPHVHIILRDRDVDTHRRVMETTERGSTERFRLAWEQECNQALERAGHDARIDRRTLEAQGIDREPQIHVGPGVKAMEEKGITPASQPRDFDRIDFATGEPVTMSIDYPAIDQGRTRSQFNDEIKERNALREKLADPGWRDYIVETAMEIAVVSPEEALAFNAARGDGTAAPTSIGHAIWIEAGEIAYRVEQRRLQKGGDPMEPDPARGSPQIEAEITLVAPTPAADPTPQPMPFLAGMYGLGSASVPYSFGNQGGTWTATATADLSAEYEPVAAAVSVAPSTPAAVDAVVADRVLSATTESAVRVFDNAPAGKMLDAGVDIALKVIDKLADGLGSLFDGTPAKPPLPRAAEPEPPSPPPPRGPSPEEIERQKIMADFERTYAASLDRRANEHERDGGRELER